MWLSSIKSGYVTDLEQHEGYGRLLRCRIWKPNHPMQLPDLNQQRDRKTAQGNDKRQKQKEPKKKAADPPPEETDNDKCRHHQEIQKLVKMMNGRLSFLEHCFKSEKKFPDLTDDDALVGYQKDQDELSSLKEHKLGELALFLPCPVLDCPENTNNSIKLNDPPETLMRRITRVKRATIARK
ncbi:hypothetical protein TNCV_4206191 [Trichonephila clavipes]|nr:hypothetical protein TNCV_4206191 [Trichonephila clavipes]